MKALISAAKEVRLGRHALRWGYVGDARVHLECAEAWLGAAIFKGEFYGRRMRFIRVCRLVFCLGRDLAIPSGEPVAKEGAA